MRNFLNVIFLFVFSPIFANANIKVLMDNEEYINKKDTQVCNNLADYKPNEFTTAAMHGCENQVLAMLKQGYDVNQSDTLGRTALSNAIFFYKVEMIKILLNNGANPNAMVPFLHTTHLAYTAMAYQSPRKVHNRNEILLFILKLLIVSEANVNQLEGSYFPTAPLFVWSLTGHAEGVKLLLEAGADVHGSGGTPPIMAVGSADVLKVLLDYGANINYRDKFGATVLHSAIMFGTPNTLKANINHGVDINSQKTSGETPLIWCVELQRLDLIPTLLDLGADPYIKTNKGLTAYALAKKYNYQEIVDVLEKHNIYK